MYTLTRRCCQRRPSTKRRKLAAVFDSRMRLRVSAPCVMRYVLGVSMKPAERMLRSQPEGSEKNQRGLGKYAPSQRNGMNHRRVRHDDKQVGPLVEVFHDLKIVQRGLRRAVVVYGQSSSRVGVGHCKNALSRHAQAAQGHKTHQQTGRRTGTSRCPEMRRSRAVQCHANVRLSGASLAFALAWLAHLQDVGDRAEEVERRVPVRDEAGRQVIAGSRLEHADDRAESGRGPGGRVAAAEKHGGWPGFRESRRPP